MRVSGNYFHIFYKKKLIFFKELVARNCGFLTRNNYFVIGFDKNIIMKFKGGTMEAKHQGIKYPVSSQNLTFIKNLTQETCKFLP
jgi:hypothetical protein